MTDRHLLMIPPLRDRKEVRPKTTKNMSGYINKRNNAYSVEAQLYSNCYKLLR